MIPFRDDNPSGTVPFVTIGLIVMNVAVFAVEWSQLRQERRDAMPTVIAEYAMQPAEVARAVRGKPVPGQRFPVLLTPLTSMFMHGGLLHLVGNMLYLWIFGDNVEDRMGHAKYLVFYLLCGLGAAAAHTAVDPSSNVPTVGASGAIAGVLGAYLLAFPRAQVATLVPLGILLTVIRLPAVIVLGFWFALQFISGMGSLRMPQTGGVAWWAHIGGFVAGMLLLFVFQKRTAKRRPYGYYRTGG